MAETMVNHAPIKTKKIKIKHHHPWFNDKLKSEIKLRWKEKCVVMGSNRIQFTGLL